MSHRSEARRFLRLVWKHQRRPDGSVVFLSTKNWDTNRWKDYPQEGSLKFPSMLDMYFTPNAFSAPRRLEANALPGKLLWADLDEIDPASLPARVRPTVAWETSPGRFQCLWFLERPLRPQQLQLVNHKLTDYTMADAGGWSITKVLRVPGSSNNKRDERFYVRLLWDDGKVYSSAEIYNEVRDVPVYEGPGSNVPLPELPKVSVERLIKRHRSKMGISLIRALKTEWTGGDRSEAMWKLERGLVEAGVPAAAILKMVMAAPFNKYRGQRREQEQIWHEIQKAIDSGKSTKSSAAPTSRPAATPSRKTAKPGSSSPSSTERSRSTSKLSRSKNTSTSSSASQTDFLFEAEDEEIPDFEGVSYADFMGKPIRRKLWTVEGVWSSKAFGLIVGPSKAFKSTLTLDLAVSVASGTSFLDRFPIKRKGSVLLIQEENEPSKVWQDLDAIAASRDLGASVTTNGTRNIKVRGHRELPIELWNNLGVNLANSSHLVALERWIIANRPALIVLDPWYYLTPGVDENSARQVTPIVRNLILLKQKYQTGIMVVHHYNKENVENPRKARDRVSGSSVFGRSYESLLTIERPDDKESSIQIDPWHRGHGDQPTIHVTFDLEDGYSVETEIGHPKQEAVENQIAAIVARNGGKVTLAQLEEELDVSRPTARKRALEAGAVVAKGRQNGSKATFVKMST